jgi:hypothetical protein
MTKSMLLIPYDLDWFREKYLPALNAGKAKHCIDRHPRCSHIENGRCSAAVIEELEEERRERLSA